MITRQHIIDAASTGSYTLADGSRIAICEIPHPGGFSRATEIRIRIAGDLRPLRGHGSSDAGIVARGWMSRTGPRSSIGRAIDALILSAAVPASVFDAREAQDAIDAERSRALECACLTALRALILASTGSAVVPASVLDACSAQDSIDAEAGRAEIAAEDATRARILASMGSAVCVIGGAR